MKKILLNIAALLFAWNMAAQFQINGSVNDVDWGSFNNALSTNDFPTLNEYVLSISVLQARHEEDKALGSRTGFLANIYSKDYERVGSNGNSTNEVNLRSLAFLSGIEYHIINKKGITFGPSLDVLIIQQRLDIISGLPDTLAFSNVLAGDVEKETYRNLRLMLDGRLNLIFNFQGKKENTFGIGFTGGYRLDPMQTNWRYERSIDIDIPGSQQNGWLLGIVFTVKGKNIKAPKPPKINQKRS